MLYFETANDITVYFEETGKIARWTSNDSNYNTIKQIIKEKDYDKLEIYTNMQAALMDNTVKVGNNNITIIKNNKEFTYDSNTDNKFVSFILLLKKKGIIDDEIERIKPFLHNMFSNPFIDAAEEIYDYCKAMDFEITSDGCFLAYKRVNKDLTSIYDGKTQHKIGEYTSVSAFDTDRTQVCSKGLHFCSKGYLSQYTGDTILIVKINPADVVAIPTDYAYQKGRCRKYMPIGTIEPEEKLSDVKVQERLGEDIVNTRKLRKNLKRAIRTIKKTLEVLDEIDFRD